MRHSTDVSDAKAVCECRILGVDIAGAAPATGPEVFGVGITAGG